MIPSYSIRAPRIEYAAITGESREHPSPHRRENIIACSTAMITGASMATGFQESIIPGGCIRDGAVGALDAPMLAPGGSALSSNGSKLVPSYSRSALRR